MIQGGLALVATSVLGSLPNSDCVQAGVIPSAEFAVRFNGVELSLFSYSSKPRGFSRSELER
jgi:hypothetical protein